MTGSYLFPEECDSEDYQFSVKFKNEALPPALRKKDELDRFVDDDNNRNAFSSTLAKYPDLRRQLADALIAEGQLKFG